MSRTIPIQRSKLVVIVDDEDYPRLSQYKWFVGKPGRAYRSTLKDKKTKNISMHYDILEKRDGLVIDHKNGNKLDNRKENLRYCTHAENSRNRKRVTQRSPYKGVTFRASNNPKPWEAVIGFNNIIRYLGSYDTAENAAIAYDMVALMWHKEFARTNILKPYEQQN